MCVCVCVCVCACVMVPGLLFRSEMVREACVNGLLNRWSCNLNGNLLPLLTRRDVESSPEV